MLCAAVPAAANADDPVPTTFHTLPPVSHTLPLVLAAGGETTGLVRIVNHSNEAGTVRVEAIDDAGVRFGPVTLELAAKHAVQLTSFQLERGNARRGLPEGVGNGKGHWRLKLTSTLDIEPGAYARTPRGFLTSMHDSVAEDGAGRWHVPLFNPGSNQSRVSLLRLVNTSDMPATVDIDGVDDRGWPADGRVRLTLAPRAARTVSARALESGEVGLYGRLGDGTGRWRLDVSADRPLQVMNLLRSRSGHLTNLSTTTGPDEDLSITFVGCEAPQGFHAYLARGARAAGEDLGVDVTYVYPEEVLVPASQLRLIDDAIAAEADGIAVCAYLDDDEYRDVASRANASGVAFASAAAPPPGTVLRNPYDLFLFRTGADERAAGALTARQLLSMGVRGRVVLLNHRPNDVTCRHRADSQREVLEKHGVRVALVERDMDAPGQSQALLGELQRHPRHRGGDLGVCRARPVAAGQGGERARRPPRHRLRPPWGVGRGDSRRASGVQHRPAAVLARLHAGDAADPLHPVRIAAVEPLPDRSGPGRCDERGAGGGAGGAGVSLSARRGMPRRPSSLTPGPSPGGRGESGLPGARASCPLEQSRESAAERAASALPASSRAPVRVGHGPGHSSIP